MNKTRNKRRQYFIDKDFQTKFILKFCAIVIISSLLIGGLIFLFSQNSTTVAIENTKVVVKRTADFILPVMIGTLLIVALFSALVVTAMTLLASHKIAGPLYRLKQEIDILKEADLTRSFNIRAKDQLQALAKSLNDMSDSLRKKHTELKKKCSTLISYLKEKNFRIQPEQKEEFSKMLQDIEDILNYFKV
jgi:nitrogen fixation/metabolism regulation signal transduction histidine kinase